MKVGMFVAMQNHPNNYQANHHLYWDECRLADLAEPLGFDSQWGVEALFSLEVPAGGPFPSDLFTVADSRHNTRRRVKLPKPNCMARPSDCADLDVINTLDGFNLQPRLSIMLEAQ